MNVNNKQDRFGILDDWDSKSKSKLLRRRYPQLTPSDLSFAKDDENDLLERIKQGFNKKQAEVIEIIKNKTPNKFINNLKIHYHE